MPKRKYDQAFLERFVVAWQEADTLQDVLDVMEIKAQPARQLASNLRRQSVPLKMMSRAQTIDYHKLANIADDVRPDDV